VVERKRDQWIKDLVDGSWYAAEYAEGSVFGVMLDAWFRELGPEKATDRMGSHGPGMPQAEELLDAAERAGLQYWEAYPRGEVNNMIGMAEEAGAYACIEQSELDNCGDGD